MFLFLRVSYQVVEFGVGRVDVVVGACFQGMQRAPAERTERIESLTVTFIFGFGARAEQSLGLELFLNRVLNSRDAYQRGSHRNRFDRPGNPSRPNAALSRRFHDQRHMNRGGVDKKTMLLFAVFTQRLPVVAQKRNQAAVVELVKL